MGRLTFSAHAEDDYLWWQREDRAVHERINRLIEHAMRDPYAGVGKPERLKFTLAGTGSRRITGEHRMVYVPRPHGIDIAALRYHYR